MPKSHTYNSQETWTLSPKSDKEGRSARLERHRLKGTCEDGLHLLLSASYVHSLIHGLLGSKQSTRIAHCSNRVSDDADSNTRPDYKIDVYHSYEYAYSNVYGEIKSEKNISPTMVIEDFYRIAISCKDALDEFC